MIDLLTGADHADPYVWSAALLAHAMLGLILTAALAAVIDAADVMEVIPDRGRFAAGMVVVAYLVAWEGAVQHFGEGLAGSLTDTVAIAGGAVIGLMAWARQGGRLAVAALAVAAIWVWGIGPRLGGRRG